MTRLSHLQSHLQSVTRWVNDKTIAPTASDQNVTLTVNGNIALAVIIKRTSKLVKRPILPETKMLYKVLHATRSSNKLVELYKRFQSHGHVNKKACCSKFNACRLLCCRGNLTLNFCICWHYDLASRSSKRGWSMYTMHKSTIMPSFNAIAILSEIWLL